MKKFILNLKIIKNLINILSLLRGNLILIKNGKNSKVKKKKKQKENLKNNSVDKIIFIVNCF